MKLHSTELRQRLGFIDRTIVHAMRACESDRHASTALRDDLRHLGKRSDRARQALDTHDPSMVLQRIEDLAQLGEQTQSHIRPGDEVGYAVKSAVILAHIELSALRHQLG